MKNTIIFAFLLLGLVCFHNKSEAATQQLVLRTTILNNGANSAKQERLAPKSAKQRLKSALKKMRKDTAKHNRLGKAFLLGLLFGFFTVFALLIHFWWRRNITPSEVYSSSSFEETTEPPVEDTVPPKKGSRVMEILVTMLGGMVGFSLGLLVLVLLA